MKSLCSSKISPRSMAWIELNWSAKISIVEHFRRGTKYKYKKSRGCSVLAGFLSCFLFKNIYIKSRSLKKILLRNKLEKDILKLSFYLTKKSQQNKLFNCTTSHTNHHVGSHQRDWSLHCRVQTQGRSGCKLKEDQLNKTPSQQLEVTLKTDLLWWEGNCAGPKQFRPAKDQLVDVCCELFLTQILEIWKLWFLAMWSLCSVLWSQYILFEHRTKLYFVYTDKGCDAKYVK